LIRRERDDDGVIGADEIYFYEYDEWGNLTYEGYDNDGDTVIDRWTEYTYKLSTFEAFLEYQLDGDY
jgi:hypothetical protein